MSQRWAMLLVIFFTRTSLGFQFQSIAALTPFLVAAFDLSWAQVGLLMGLFMRRLPKRCPAACSGSASAACASSSPASA